MKKGKKFYIVGAICVIILGVIAFFVFMPKPLIEFKDKEENIEINGEYNPSDFIKEVKGDVDIDNSKVDVTHLGKYEISYIVQGKTYTLKVNIVDSNAPTLDVKDLDIALGSRVEPKDFVQSVEDETEITLSFDKEYKFDQEGEFQIGIIAIDQGGNKTQKESLLKIIKDTEKPTLNGLKDITVKKETKIDYLKGVTASDNLDKEPKIDVDSSQVDVSKLGTYKVQYTVTDQAGNQNTYTKTVTVADDKKVVTIPASGSKIMYLTFDDGPSANTGKILDILDQYDAKATFFVTGNGQKYNYLIKTTHDKGHTIALHTYTHDYKTVYSSVDDYFNDLTKIGNMVKGIIGYVPKYIRFPGGSSNAVSKHYTKGIMTTLVSEVQNRGYQYYDWNASSGDAGGNGVAVSKLVANSTSSHASNIMLLCHDTAAKSTTVQALPQIIEHYKNLGYVFKGIDDSSFTPHHGLNN